MSLDTNTHTYPQTSFKEVVETFKAMCQYMFRRWQLILLFVIVGGILGALYGKFKKPRYIATLTFVLDEGEGGGGALSQFSGVASMVGIDLGSGSGGGVFRGDNIMELYRSRRMMVKTLLTPLNKEELLIDRYLNFSNLRATWADNPALKNLNFHVPVEQFTVKHDSVLTQAVKFINENMLKVGKPDKKLNIIKVEVEAKDELFAKALTETLVDEVNRFYTETRTKNSTENLKIIQHQTDSVRRELRAAISGSAQASQVNPNANPARQILRVPSQNRQVDVSTNSAILEELVKNLEISKLASIKNRPLIQTIDTPVLPLVKDHTGVGTGIVIGVVISLLIAFLLLSAGFILSLLLK